MTTTKTQLILFYDYGSAGTGNAFIKDVHGEFFDRRLGEVLIPLDTHSTLPGAVGEARRLGHKVEGWTSVNSNLGWILGVDQIRTPFDGAVNP